MRYDFISLWILIVLVNSNKNKNSVTEKKFKLVWTKKFVILNKTKS